MATVDERVEVAEGERPWYLESWPDDKVRELLAFANGEGPQPEWWENLRYHDPERPLWEECDARGLDEWRDLVLSEALYRRCGPEYMMVHTLVVALFGRIQKGSLEWKLLFNLELKVEALTDATRDAAIEMGPKLNECFPHVNPEALVRELLAQ